MLNKSSSECPQWDSFRCFILSGGEVVPPVRPLLLFRGRFPRPDEEVDDSLGVTASLWPGIILKGFSIRQQLTQPKKIKYVSRIRLALYTADCTCHGPDAIKLLHTVLLVSFRHEHDVTSYAPLHRFEVIF